MNLSEILSDIENWYDDHERKKRRRRDERLGSYTKKQLKYFVQDRLIHPERYELVSKAEIKATRKRFKKW